MAGPERTSRPEHRPAVKTLALAFISFLAGYGAASIGMEIASQRAAFDLRDALDEMSDDEVKRSTEPFHGHNVVPVTSLTDTAPVTVTVLPAWATLYSRDEA